LGLLDAVFGKKGPVLSAKDEELFDDDFQRKLDYLALVSKRVFAGRMRAERRTKKTGSGVEFADHRDYQPGDDFRRIDWKKFAQNGALVLRQFEEERDARIYVMLDLSGSMARGKPPKIEAAKRIAQGAAMMTDTKLDTVMILGSAWSGHFNKAIAQATQANIQRVGNPKWDANDIALAKGIQHELKVKEVGLETEVDSLGGPVDPTRSLGGGSDDIGDISWNVPTVTLRYPSNIPGLPGHNWANAVSMATPIAHKGTTAGAKVQALTVLDLLTRPELVQQAWDYFNNVQTKNKKYTPLLRPEDKPATFLNEEIMAKWRPLMRKYYFDPTKYKTYLEQLGIEYPTVRKTSTSN